MSNGTIGIMSPGDMGHAVAGVIDKQGYRVLTLLDGRSDLTRERAARSNMEDAGSLEALVGEADAVLSIMPPELAQGFAADAAVAMKSAGRSPIFADCNAVSPATTTAIGDEMAAVGAKFIKIGIVGPPPGPGRQPRFFASGADTSELAFLDSEKISYLPMGDDITRAAAVKMCYAGLTKGMMTLHTSVLVAAELLGVSDELRAAFAETQKFHWEAMNNRVPFYPADAGRWSGEMDQISETLGNVGVTPNLHKGAADTFRLLDETPLSSETRETLDRSRTLDQAVKIYADTVRNRLKKDEAAE